MPAKTITTSPNIALIDSKISANLCDGIFRVDLTPSIWIGSGASNVLGASVKITNPYNVIIKNYPTSGYDIYSPMTDVIAINIPTQAGNFQYGNYAIEVQLKDANGTLYNIIKTVSICEPDANNKTRNYGSLSAQLNGICKDGKIYIIADTVPTYKGNISNSQVNYFTLEYPTSSGLSILNTSMGIFSAVLFEGVYKFKGTICANYNLGDNISVQVNYKLKKEKNIRCLLDETCIYAKLSQLDSQTKSDCTDAEKIDTQNVIIGALRLIKTIEVATNAGFDAGDFVDELESLLGCVCTCNCADGTPIININPAKDFSITGCNVSKTTVGLTDTYLIDNFQYVIQITDNGGAITISSPVLANCIKTQSITFNIAAIYAQIKNQIVNTTEYNFWASIINKSWDSLNITCLGIAQILWDSYTLNQRTQVIIDNLCAGGSCAAIISTNTTTTSANNVRASWVNVTGVYETSAYLDGVLAGTVLYPGTIFNFVGAADGQAHTYKLISKCSNGSVGVSLVGSFTAFGCPYISVPIVSLNSVPNATCPYNLTPLVSGLPMGITAEWHNLNNTNASSIVPDATQVTDGTYFVFGKNSNGCYSLPAQVVVVCSIATNCSAPQSLLLESIIGGYRVRFQSAAFPPPSNSYSVKRRLNSDPDVSGSYTTIGTPTFNSSANRWEILDTTGIDNTLYTYRVISNCTSTAPYSDYIFANITCPVVTLTPFETSAGYSFAGVGGSIDKYEVKIYSSDGITLIHTDTKLPAFSNPLTGTFIYLAPGVTYNVRIRAWIGTYFKDCAFQAVTTTYNYRLSASYNMSIDSVTGVGIPTLTATGINMNKYGHQTGISGTISITISGTPPISVPIKLDVVKNGSSYACIATSGAGTYSLAVSSIESDIISISINSGTC